MRSQCNKTAVWEDHRIRYTENGHFKQWLSHTRYVGKTLLLPTRENDKNEDFSLKKSILKFHLHVSEPKNYFASNEPTPIAV